MRRITLATTAAALLPLPALAACASSGNATHSPTSSQAATSTTATSTATASTTATSATASAKAPATTTPAPTTSNAAAPATNAAPTTNAAERVDCGLNDIPAGHIHLYAESTAEGIPGCTEVINVATDYATQDAGADQSRMVDGWSCAPLPSAPGFRCTKEGLIFNSVTPQAG